MKHLIPKILNLQNSEACGPESEDATVGFHGLSIRRILHLYSQNDQDKVCHTKPRSILAPSLSAQLKEALMVDLQADLFLTGFFHSINLLPNVSLL